MANILVIKYQIDMNNMECNLIGGMLNVEGLLSNIEK